MQIFVNWLCSCWILLNCFVLVYALIENVMSIYELFLNVCIYGICMFLFDFCLFLSCIMFIYYDGCEWWLCRVNCVWLSVQKQILHWGKMNTENAKEFCMFSSQCKWSKNKKNVIEYNKHVMLEEELWMQWLWFYGSIINTACIVIIREMLQFNQ